MTRTITHNDKGWFYRLFDNDKDAEEVINYMEHFNVSITEETGGKDVQSGFSEWRVKIDGIDLSINGFCFRKENLLNHVRRFPDYRAAMDEPDYQEYLRLKKKYGHIDKYLNR